jgi:formylglycine-generating enzyme required for sulfatase activity
MIHDAGRRFPETGIIFLFIFMSAIFASGQPLGVDSVTVDSVWNSDSVSGPSRDCRVSFVPIGQAWVQAQVEVSPDNGATWWNTADSLSNDSVSVLENALYAKVPCGQKRTVTVRIRGGDRDPCIVRVKVRQLDLAAAFSLVSIPAGTFQMGEAGIYNAEPVHRVTLTSFGMMHTEITQEQFATVQGYNPANFKNGGDYPVEFVTWFDAVLFCNSLSRLLGYDTCYRFDSAAISGSGDGQYCNLIYDITRTGFRLPTEAEWEYACRAGTTSFYFWGPDTNGLGANAWSNYSSGRRTHSVAGLAANPFSLHDMAGNVWEWNNDCILLIPQARPPTPRGRRSEHCSG